MPIPKRAIRSINNIRTHSGKVDLLSEPYRAFMRVSALEMEKARRGKERDSAMHRVFEIDARFREIEKEKAYLLNGIAGIKTIKTLNNQGTQPSQHSALNPGSFKIRY